MLVLAMEFSRGTWTERNALSPGETARGRPEAGVNRCLGRRASHSLKTEQRIAWSLARPDPGGSCLQETVAYDGDGRGRRQASDQLGVDPTGVRGSKSLERR